MNGNFIYENPTKLIFGDKALDKLSNELNKYGDNILLVYGGGSLKKTGLYDRIIKILKESNKNVIEDSGVMSNPTIDKLIDGVNIVRNNNIDFILAVGGGSVIDYTKALAASVNLKDDIWQYYFINHKEPNCKVLPHGNVLTMVGTGSEMNGGSVITNPHTKEK
jgi:alcohol dehydrogenase YqhD (iron-dependent ADH family)